MGLSERAYTRRGFLRLIAWIGLGLGVGAGTAGAFADTLASCGGPRSSASSTTDPSTTISTTIGPKAAASSTTDPSTAASPTIGASAAASPAVSITVDRSRPATSLDPSFVGLSYEKSNLSGRLFSPANTSLIGLFRRLGPSVLRVGGASVDTTTWRPTTAGETTGFVAASDIDRFAGFLQATGWKTIYGVNLANSTPALAADEAAYAAARLGTSLTALEIGNEPDRYHSDGHRPSSYSYSDFRLEWGRFAAAIRARVPGAPLAGPAAASRYESYALPFAHDEAPVLTLLSQHYYMGSGRSPKATIASLLGDTWRTGLAAELALLAGAAQKRKIPHYRITETNSFSGGGVPGVSDSFASALWVIEFLFALAQGGASGANFHGGGNALAYTPIVNDSSGQVLALRPECYGLLLFSLAARGRLLSTASKARPPWLSAYAVEGADRSTSVVVLNKDAVHSCYVTVELGAPANTARLTTMTAPSLESTTGVLLGGAPIGLDGSWMPVGIRTLPISGGMLAFTVPAASALLVQAR